MSQDEQPLKAIPLDSPIFIFAHALFVGGVFLKSIIGYGPANFNRPLNREYEHHKYSDMQSEDLSNFYVTALDKELAGSGVYRDCREEVRLSLHDQSPSEEQSYRLRELQDPFTQTAEQAQIPSFNEWIDQQFEKADSIIRPAEPETAKKQFTHPPRTEKEYSRMRNNQPFVQSKHNLFQPEMRNSRPFARSKHNLFQPEQAKRELPKPAPKKSNYNQHSFHAAQSRRDVREFFQTQEQQRQPIRGPKR